MADIERWITVNGVHIPIMKGESKARAVGNFIKGKRDAVKGKRRSLYAKWNDLERILHRADQQEDWETYNEYSKDYDKAAKAAKDFDAKHPERTIKGRAKTKEERYNDINKEYSEKAKAADKMYNNKPLRDWAELESNRKFYANALQKAEHEREERLKNEKIFSSDRYKLKTDKPKATYSATELARMSEYKLRKLYDNASEVDRKSITSEMGTRGYTRLNNKWVDRYKKRNYNRTHKRDPYD